MFQNFWIRGKIPVLPPWGRPWSEVKTTFLLKKFWQNAQMLKFTVSVSNYKSRVSVSELLMKSRSRLEILTRSKSRSVSKVTVSTTSLVHQKAAVMRPSHICRISVGSESQAFLVRIISNFFESSHKNCQITSSDWFANSSQCRVKWNLTWLL